VRSSQQHEETVGADSNAADRLLTRRRTLENLGATGREVEELLEYNRNPFAFEEAPGRLTVPLPSQLHVATWKRYAEEAAEMGVFETLREKLIQLQFPIAEEISKSEAYRLATLKGIPPDKGVGEDHLRLDASGELQLLIHQTAAGETPVLLTREREDFVMLVQALAGRNEPIPVPDSMGACAVTGLNNWDRVRQYRHNWEEKGFGGEEAWASEFQRMAAHKELYQDRLLILSDGPYSGVSGACLGLTDEDWREKSIIIRMEHECAHYFTKRVLGSMRDNVLDELMADYAGIVASEGGYRSNWFLRFMGLENFPEYRSGGRLENYRGSPALSDGAFRILADLTSRATGNLEKFDVEQCGNEQRDMLSGAAALLALSSFTLEELATPQACSLLTHQYRRRLAVLR